MPRTPSAPAALPPDTRRLRFGRWEEGDLEAAWTLWGDPRVTARLGSGRPWTRAEVRARLEAEIACQGRYGVQYWPLFLLADGELVGCCGLRPKDPERGVWELGVHLRPGFWGRGLAAEAARAVIALAFRSLGAAALFAGHHPENGPSRRLLARLGFGYTHDEFYPPTGTEHPSYRLTAAEFAAGEARREPGQSRRGSM